MDTVSVHMGEHCKGAEAKLICDTGFQSSLLCRMKWVSAQQGVSTNAG